MFCFLKLFHVISEETSIIFDSGCFSGVLSVRLKVLFVITFNTEPWEINIKKLLNKPIYCIYKTETLQGWSRADFRMWTCGSRCLQQKKLDVMLWWKFMQEDKCFQIFSLLDPGLFSPLLCLFYIFISQTVKLCSLLFALLLVFLSKIYFLFIDWMI